MDFERLRSSAKDPYSHSIINEPAKLLIRKLLAIASQTFTVIFTVNPSGTSIGAGFRAVRPSCPFEIYRHLSTRANNAHSIGGCPGRSRNRLTSAGIELNKLLS